MHCYDCMLIGGLIKDFVSHKDERRKRTLGLFKHRNSEFSFFVQIAGCYVLGDH